MSVHDEFLSALRTRICEADAWLTSRFTIEPPSSSARSAQLSPIAWDADKLDVTTQQVDTVANVRATLLCSTGHYPSTLHWPKQGQLAALGHVDSVGRRTAGAAITGVLLVFALLDSCCKCAVGAKRH
jgi:hypothetical protein